MEKIENFLTDEKEIKGLSFSGDKISSADFSRFDICYTVFEGCCFEGCTFESSSFVDVTFRSCLFAMCDFENGFFKDCKFIDSKADGCGFNSALFKNTGFSDCCLKYANFNGSSWKNSRVDSCNMGEAILSECKISKSVFENNILDGVDFFKTPLKGAVT